MEGSVTHAQAPARVDLGPRIGWSRDVWYIVLLGIALGTALAMVPAVALVLVLLPVVGLVLLRPHLVVFGVVLVAPFEEVLLKFLPVPDNIYSAARFGSEILIYLSFGVVVVSHLLQGRRLRRTPIDMPLAIFLVCAFASLVVNKSPIVGSVVNLRPFLRYIFLFYLVANLDLTEKELKRFMLLVLACGAAQIVIGVMEIIGGNAVSNLFLPRDTTIDIGGLTKSFTILTKTREEGSIFGSLSDTVVFGAFIVVVNAVSLGRIRKWNFMQFLWITAMLLLSAFSYSRASLVVCMGCIMWWFRLRYGWKPMLQLSAAGAVILALLLTPVILSAPSQYVNPTKAKESIVQNITGVFNANYVQIAEKQRLASILGNVPTVVVNKPLLGYGPDQESAIDHLNSSQHSFLLKVWSVEGFKDVYWAALLTFYGLLGFGAIFVMIRGLFNAAMKIRETSTMPIVVDYASGTSVLIIATTVLCLFNRALEFRSFGLYFWLWPALMLAGTSLEARSRQEIPQ